jgi:tRNA modification GTPase
MSLPVQADTIFALSSGSLPAGVAVIRVSGPFAKDVLLRHCAALPAERAAVLRSINNVHGELIDRGLVVWFRAPFSFTGEDVAEFHLHGGAAVVEAMLSSIGTISGCRPAEPGEFTQRAFLNGRMDLTAAEGLADLIEARTEMQRRQALRNSSGEQERLYEGWRQAIVELLARIEAELDFADEGDVASLSGEALEALVGHLIVSIDEHLARYASAEIVRNGYRVVIAGRPNVGKSSLFNHLVQRDAAIVTAIAGTTRDVLEVELSIGGHRVILADTAGLRQTDDPVELIGIDRARRAAMGSDLVIALRDSELMHPLTPGIEAEVLDVVTKADLHDAGIGSGAIRVSSVTGAGIPELLAAIAERVDRLVDVAEAVPTRQRHVNALETCRRHLRNVGAVRDAVLNAEELRLAAAALGRLTGRIDVEDILDAVFSRFCIGK